MKAWREARGLTQVELARLLGVDSITISRWERGVTKRAVAGRVLELALERLDQQIQQPDMQKPRPQ